MAILLREYAVRVGYAQIQYMIINKNNLKKYTNTFESAPDTVYKSGHMGGIENW